MTDVIQDAESLAAFGSILSNQIAGVDEAEAGAQIHESDMARPC